MYYTVSIKMRIYRKKIDYRIDKDSYECIYYAKNIMNEI